MSIATRGVKRRYVSKDVQVEEVCTCICHDESGVMHIMACCHSPKTDAGVQALKEYNDSHR